MGVIDTFTATTGTSTTAVSSLALTVPRAVASGTSIILASVRGDGGGTVGLASVVDSRSNTWVLNDASALRASNEQVMLSHAHLTTGLQVGDTITVTWNTAATRLNLIAHVVSGLQTVNPEATSGTVITAGTNSGPNGSGTAVTASTAGATTTAQCLVVAAVGVSNTAALPMTAGTSYTSGGSVATTAGTNDRGLATEYMTTSAAGVQTAAATLGTSSTWAETVAAYPLSAPAPTVNAGADQVKYAGELVALAAAVTGTTTGGSWSQVSGPVVSRTTINTTTSSFPADLDNTADVVRVFRYTATYTGGSVTDDVTVTVAASQVLTAKAGAYVAGQAYTA